jgi:kinesin family protein C1
MEVSFVEIYCEKIRDLLADFGSGGAKPKKGVPSPEHKIVRNDQGANVVSNAAMIPVDPSDVSKLAELMEVAGRARATKKTDMNETSSRSHSVFTLHLSATNRKLGAVSHGQLNVQFNKKGCNSSAMVILAPIALLCRECYAYNLFSWHCKLHCS